MISEMGVGSKRHLDWFWAHIATKTDVEVLKAKIEDMFNKTIIAA